MNTNVQFGMSQEQFESVRQPIIRRADISTSDLDDKTPRTLLLGKTESNAHFHVYLDEKGILNRVVYEFGELIEHAKGESLTARLLSPSGYVFPETTDYTLAKTLRERDVVLTYTVYRATRPKEAFYGSKAEELTFNSLKICA